MAHALIGSMSNCNDEFNIGSYNYTLFNFFFGITLMIMAILSGVCICFNFSNKIFVKVLFYCALYQVDSIYLS